jgi:type IV secretion system protein TrbE
MAPLYEEFTRRLQWRAAHLSDKVPWRMLAAPGIMLHKQSNALQRTYALRGPDLSGETKEVQGALMLQANNVFKRLGGAWTIHSEAQRMRMTIYPESRWPHPVAALIDQERRRAIVEAPGSRETRYFLTLTWQPPSQLSQRWQRVVVSGPREPQVVEDTLEPEVAGVKVGVIQRFLHESDYLMDLLHGMLAMARLLNTNEMLTYLHSCVSDRWHPVVCPILPIDLDVRLCDRPFVGGWYPYWGTPPMHEGDPDDRTHIRICSIMSYPAKSVAGALKALESQDLDFRWCTRWMALDKNIQANLLRKTQGAWQGQERSIFARMAESVSGKPTRMTDPDATNKFEEAKVAREELGADIIAYGDFTSTMMVWDIDPAMADEKLRQVMQVLDSQGFITTVEKQHATAAWLSTHPGNRVDSVRRTPQHSLTLAHLCPGLQAAWPGPERDEYLDGPPWFLGHTDGSTLIRVVNHVLDNGHFMVLGPTRSGKSTLLGLQKAQWLKYKQGKARAICLDLGKTDRCLTLCLGGDWHDLGGGQVGLQPYRNIHELEERSFRYEWTLDRLAESDITLEDDARWSVAEALDKLARARPPERTFSEFVFVLTEMLRVAQVGSRNRHSPHYMRLKRLRDALSHIVRALSEFTRGHLHGHFLDADHDDIRQAPIQTFEQESLLRTPRMVKPVMSHVFHELELGFDTSHPTLLLMDDAAVAWVLPDYEGSGCVFCKRV